MVRPKQVMTYVSTVDAVAKDFTQQISKRLVNNQIHNLHNLVGKWALEGKTNTKNRKK